MFLATGKDEIQIQIKDQILQSPHPSHFKPSSQLSPFHKDISLIKSIAKLSITGLPPLLIAVLTEPRENAQIALWPKGRLRRYMLEVEIAFSRSRDLTAGLLLDFS